MVGATEIFFQINITADNGTLCWRYLLNFGDTPSFMEDEYSYLMIAIPFLMD